MDGLVSKLSGFALWMAKQSFGRPFSKIAFRPQIVHQPPHFVLLRNHAEEEVEVLWHQLQQNKSEVLRFASKISAELFSIRLFAFGNGRPK